RRDRRQLTGEDSAAYTEDRRRWTINSKGHVWAEFDFPRAGEYQIRVSASATQAGDEPARMEVSLGSKKLKVFDINSVRGGSDYALKTQATAGKQKLIAAFINDFYDPDAKDRDKRDRNLYVYGIEIDGPLDFREGDYP